MLRTPEERFADLAGFPFEPRYYQLRSGARIHYVDEGRGAPILCLHGEPSWCYLYRKMIPPLAARRRVVAPDLLGFGRSDKLPQRADYTYALHFDALREFVEALDLRQITLVCQDWGGLLGLPLAAELGERFASLVIMNTGLPTGDPPGANEAFLAWRNFAATTPDMDIGRVIQGGCCTTLSPETIAAYDAPFPDPSYKAGALQFPLLVPIAPDDPASAVMKLARQRLRAWTKPALVMFSDGDPITRGGDRFFRGLIPSAVAEPEIVIQGAGHFLQEDRGEEIAARVLEFLERHG